MSEDLRNQRRGGFYWEEQKPYISVTTALKVLDKPALMYWFGKQVYLAMVQDPTLSQKEALAFPYKVSKKAMSRGTTVHSIVEAWKKTGVKIDAIDEVRGYADAFYKFREDHPEIEAVEHEKTVFNEEWGYGGTIDLIAKLNGKYILVDAKTGKGLYPELTLQLSAYAEMSKVELGGLYGLLLKEDGSYTFEERKPNFNGFLMALNLWKSVYEEKLEKIGYYEYWSNLRPEKLQISHD